MCNASNAFCLRSWARQLAAVVFPPTDQIYPCEKSIIELQATLAGVCRPDGAATVATQVPTG